VTRQAPARAERRSCPKCSKCGATTKLFGIEAHPTIDRTDLLTYVCSHCDGLETESVPHAKLKLVPKKGTGMPMNLAVDKAFDTETTQLLGSAFDAAWATATASNGLLLDERHAASMRELLAKFIIATAEQGEKDPNRLIEKALLRLKIMLRRDVGVFATD
jgi:hypothetical protein